jgi:hypothetical protein
MFQSSGRHLRQAAKANMAALPKNQVTKVDGAARPRCAALRAGRSGASAPGVLLRALVHVARDPVMTKVMGPNPVKSFNPFSGLLSDPSVEPARLYADRLSGGRRYQGWRSQGNGHPTRRPVRVGEARAARAASREKIGQGGRQGDCAAVKQARVPGAGVPAGWGGRAGGPLGGIGCFWGETGKERSIIFFLFFCKINSRLGKVTFYKDGSVGKTADCC